MNAFFGATWSGMSMIADLDHKVIERFLATPASRLLARALADRALGADGGDPGGRDPASSRTALGVRIHTGVAGWLVIILAAILVNSAFAGISQAIALLTRREATMIAVANFIGLPLLFLSTTMIARTQMPHWMQSVASFNPVDWGVRAAREVVLPGTAWSTVGWLPGLLLLALSAVTTAWATWTFRAYQRSL